MNTLISNRRDNHIGIKDKYLEEVAKEYCDYRELCQ